MSTPSLVSTVHRTPDAPGQDRCFCPAASTAHGYCKTLVRRANTKAGFTSRESEIAGLWTIPTSGSRTSSCSPPPTTESLDVPSLSPQIDASRPVLFPSGDLGLVLSEMNDDKNPAKNKFMFVKSVDGGLSIAAPTQIISRWSLPGQAVSASSGIPALALDPSLGRLYYAWEGWPSGESDVHLITSSDSGKTWTQPVEIKPSSPSANVFSAALAVNKDGVLGIVYYQRTSPQQLGVWTAHFTASTDGGRTFAPAVALSGQNENSSKPVAAGLPEDRFAYNGGDTVGLTATPDGLFHPFWVDSSTGSVQLWTTTASVSRH